VPTLKGMTMRRTPLAWHNLAHDRPRTLVAVAGVAFALIVVFMQSGFLQSVLRTATMVTDKLDYDVMIVSQDYLYVAEPGNFPRARLEQAASVPGVRRVAPFFIGTGAWRGNRTHPAPTDEADHAARGRSRPVLVLGFELEDCPFRAHGPFRPEDVERHLDALKAPDAVLVDRRSRKEFGPLAVGMRPEISLRDYRVVGLFAMGSGFAADGAILVGDQAFGRICGADTLRHPNLGLVQLEPGADADAVAAEIAAALPPHDSQVFTRDAYRFREMRYWVVSRSIGVIFTTGVSVAFLVGAVVAYQVLSSDVDDHAAEYATLRAIGYTGGQLSGVVLQQGLLIAAASYAPALLISWYLYGVVEARAVIPIDMDPRIAVPILVLAAAMCAASAVGALRRINAADPADVF